MKVDVYCVDIGSVARNRLGWARRSGIGGSFKESTDIHALVSDVNDSFDKGNKVALGFECPLYVPFREDPKELTRRRTIDGAHPWSAGAGCGALVTGLVQTSWILERVLQHRRKKVPFFLEWKRFERAREGLFLWEAFVSGKVKAATHAGDATLAVREFLRRLPTGLVADEPERVISILGLALLRSGWSTDSSLLAAPCVVVKLGSPVRAASTAFGKK